MHVYLTEHHFDSGASEHIIAPTTDEEKATEAGAERAEKFGYTVERAEYHRAGYARQTPPCDLVQMWESPHDTGCFVTVKKFRVIE